MTPQEVASLNCPNCRNQFNAPIERVIDAQTNPEVKARLLSGQLNYTVCPQCGFQGALSLPFLYHDADLELALVFMPMEAGLDNLEQQRQIGQLTNKVLEQLPPEERKGYLLQPRVFVSIQNLIDALLEEDQATREAIEIQKQKMELVEKLQGIDLDDSLALAAFVGEHDKALDPLFFQFLGMFIQMNQAQDQQHIAEQLTQAREKLLKTSTWGKLVHAQEKAVNAFAENPSRETLIEQLVAATDQGVREALVTVGRTYLDYAFFQALTTRIKAEQDPQEKDRLIALRKEVQAIRDQVDARTAAAMQERANLLQGILMSDKPAELIAQHPYEIDDLFFNVLNANLRQAHESGNQDMLKRLRQIGALITSMMQQNAPPELQLLNRLFEAQEQDQDITSILTAERETLTDSFFQMLEQMLAEATESEQEQATSFLQNVAEKARQIAA